MSGSYFSHDANARNSEELMAVRMKHGAAGYGAYFMLIERLRESDDYTSVKDYNLIAFDLRVDTALIKSVIEDFGLFAFTEDGKCFYSEGLMKRMKHKDAVSEARAKAGKIGAANRWQTPSDDAQSAENGKTIANAIEENGKTIAIKEKKSKEKKSKEKKSKEKECVCENAHTPTPAPTPEEEKFEKFKKWAEQCAPLSLAFVEPLALDGFCWLYRRYGATRMQRCAADLHSKEAYKKNRNALNTWKKWIERVS